MNLTINLHYFALTVFDIKCSYREAISKHLKDEARQRVINQWHNNKRFTVKIDAYVNGTNTSQKTDGNQTL